MPTQPDPPVDDAEIEDDAIDDGTTDDGFESYPDDDERELPADPYAELRADPALPPEVLAETIAADDAYMEAYEAALREHFGLKPRR
jgi:hypothetical protein